MNRLTIWIAFILLFVQLGLFSQERLEWNALEQKVRDNNIEVQLSKLD